MGAVHRLCSSGLSPSEGIGGAELRAAFFAIFIFRFLQCYQKSYQSAFKLALIDQEISGHDMFNVNVIQRTTKRD